MESGENSSGSSPPAWMCTSHVAAITTACKDTRVVPGINSGDEAARNSGSISTLISCQCSQKIQRDIQAMLLVLKTVVVRVLWHSTCIMHIPAHIPNTEEFYDFLSHAISYLHHPASIPVSESHPSDMYHHLQQHNKQ